MVFLSLTTCRFVKQHLHGGPPDSLDAEALKKEVDELRQKNKDLEEQVAQLQAEVSVVILSLPKLTEFHVPYYSLKIIFED